MICGPLVLSGIFLLRHPLAPVRKQLRVSSSEVQRLKLDNIQLKQRDAFKAAQQAVAEYNAVDEQRRAACDEVAKANKWPPETKCELTNPNDLVSKLVFKVPEKKPDVKPAVSGK